MISGCGSDGKCPTFKSKRKREKILPIKAKKDKIDF